MWCSVYPCPLRPRTTPVQRYCCSRCLPSPCVCDRRQDRLARMSGVARQYLELTKPRIVALLVFCAVIGMFLAVPGIPPWRALVFGTLGIWMASGSAAAFNHLIDQRIDKVMARTAHRPLATGHLKPHQVLTFALALGALSMVILVVLVN